MPIVVYAVVVLIVYIISAVFIQAILPPIAALNMIMHVIFRMSHLRLSSMSFVTAVSDKHSAIRMSTLTSHSHPPFSCARSLTMPR